MLRQWLRKFIKIPNNSKLKAGTLNGKRLYLCGYSLDGFKPSDAQNKKKCNYIYNNCKHWGFFGDGLCFTCKKKKKKCPYDKVKIEN